MTDKTRNILLMPLLLVWGCTLDGPDMPAHLPEQEDGSSLVFRASASGGEGPDYFVEGDQIRIYAQENYSVPSFTDGSPGMFVYEYVKTDPMKSYPYEFQPVDGEGFDWNTIEATGATYIFEAVHYPGRIYLEEVPERQDEPYHALPEISGLEAADLLMTYRTIPTDKKGTVQLPFHHAFSMVEVTLELPASESPAVSPFPKGAVNEAYLSQVLTRYKVVYTGSVTDGKLRDVRADGTERKNVYMNRVSVEDFDKTDASGEIIPYERTVFRAIIPEQEFLDKGRDFLFFKVRRHDRPGRETLYRFVTNDSYSLIASKILKIRLTIDSNTNEVIVVSADVKPWIEAEGEFEILPKE